MTELTVGGLRRRFLVLTALRWFPTGLLMPVLALLPLERGLTLGELGIAFALQGFVVLALELPTGGLADAVGRRGVLVAGTVVSLVSVLLFLAANSFAVFAVSFALHGIYRALDSGPLEAWYVDALLDIDPRARIEGGLSGAGLVLGVAVAAGASASGALVALGPVGGVDALDLPVIASLALHVVNVVGLATLMAERPRAVGLGAAVDAARRVPDTVRDGLRMLKRSRTLAAVVAVELFWGFSMVTFESLMPVRLADITGDGDRAAAITGPAAAVAWLASGAGAAAVPWLGRRLGIALTAASMRVMQGVTVFAMGLLAGVPGILGAYLVCYIVHGASNPAHMTVLHRQVAGPVRATVVSLNSMAAQPAGALGAIVLTALAESTSTSIAMYAGAVVLALAAPLYIPAWRQERRRPSTPATPDVGADSGQWSARVTSPASAPMGPA